MRKFTEGVHRYVLLLAWILYPLGPFCAVILVDPGHGGEELGAIAETPRGPIFEKELTLKVAKQIKKLLEKKHEVYLTRETDIDVSLEKRAAMADEKKADLFLSLHFNSARGSQYRGLEIFYLSNSKNKAVQKLEEIENIRHGGKNTIIQQILVDLVIKKTVDASRKLSFAINEVFEKRLVPRFKLRNRGVKPGIFHVLALSKRPGALIEGGFMSNEKELQTLLNSAYLKELAASIAQGVQQYLEKKKPIAKSKA